MKASGLAAGKGVVVASSRSEACKALDSILTHHKFGAAGNTVVVEELLEGEEVSVCVLFDLSYSRCQEMLLLILDCHILLL